jgi:hypothetical protein
MKSRSLGQASSLLFYSIKDKSEPWNFSLLPMNPDLIAYKESGADKAQDNFCKQNQS